MLSIICSIVVIGMGLSLPFLIIYFLEKHSSEFGSKSFLERYGWLYANCKTKTSMTRIYNGLLLLKKLLLSIVFAFLFEVLITELLLISAISLVVNIDLFYIDCSRILFTS